MVKLRERKQKIFILLVLIALLILINYNFLDKGLENLLSDYEYAKVIRVIDGDTIETENATIRLLGINTPERGEFFYEEAKEFLNNEVLNKTIKLEFTGDRYDKYDRVLAYVFLGNENINIKIVENGFANYYFYSGKDKYSEELEDAWEKCIDNKKNLCEPSDNPCAKCIEISGDFIVNNCDLDCDINGWIIKGEGREKFAFSGTLEDGEIAGFDLDVTNSGGSLFLRDSEGKLVGWGNY